VRETLGLNRKAPDEFRVVSRPPLSVPKEFYLYPPDEAPAHAAVEESKNDARDALLGGAAPQSPENYLEKYQEDAPRGGGTVDAPIAQVSAGSLPTSGEELLLGKVGAQKGNPEIRSILKQETRQQEKAKQEESLLDELRPDASDPVVDAGKERKRLQQNAKQGKPVTEGEVPVQNAIPSLWDGILK
jgi:Protein of unknown function (DUF3035)